jgi:adenine phosphoribosyltransferase
VSEARDAVLREFRWDGGHADVWAVFRDAGALRAVVSGLVEPFRQAGITAVVGIESRGFLLGAAAAVDLGVGFVPVRKAGALFPGPKVRERTGPDYRGQETELAVQAEAIGPGDRLLLVDDWVETGSQALAVARLIDTCRGELLAISVMVDQLDPHVRSRLPRVHSLVTIADLPPSDD